MKSHRIILIFLAMAFLFYLAGWSTAEAQVIQMKFAHYAEETHPGHLAAKQFAAKVEERTKGQVKIAIYPANVLGSPPEQAEQVRLGAIDMSLPTQGALDKYVKAFSVVMLPFVYDDYDHVYRTLDGPSMDWFSPLAEKEGFIVLSNWEWGFRNLTNNKRPILKPEDVKGLKIRTPPEIQLQAAMEALGGVVTKIAFPEVYMALAQNVVDAQENPIAVIYHNKFYEVQKYLSPHAACLQLHGPCGQHKDLGQTNTGATEDLQRREQIRRRLHAKGDRSRRGGSDRQDGEGWSECDTA